MKAGILSILLLTLFGRSLTGHAATITLAWDPNTEPDVTGYVVYYGATGGQATESLPTTSTYAHIPYLAAGVSYDFYVTAMSEAGLESEPSEKITYVVPEPARLTVRWDASSAAGISHYKLFYKESTSGELNSIRQEGTSYTFTSFIPGKRYSLGVRGFDAAGKEVELFRDGTVVLPGPGNWIAPLPKLAGKYMGYDAQTRGDWEGRYGEKGVLIAGTSLLAPQPAVGQLPSSDPSWIWKYTIPEPIVVGQSSSSTSTSIGTSWKGNETIQVQIPDDGGGVQRLSVYCIDSERRGIVQNVELVDATSGTVLSSVRIGSFYNGIYLNFEINRSVLVRVRRSAGQYATLSGVFLDSVAVR